ncbi:hypothetical protein DSO57_1001822 [Entomophthora muscae]|uniref:Uncharacterized protein n=1 Tax=Entomophthora muscae TaxID=34485 RepID=A0ACC2U7X5_9FUNG|nr:hypothetical protein DSO57_1001822 [Entomophthora muscae]
MRLQLKGKKDVVRIGRISPLENQAQEQGQNPDPDCLWTASLEDQGAASLHIFVIDPLQAEAQDKSQRKNTNMELRVVVPKEGILDLPSGGE